jgi:DnaJ-class molecular chaperone
MHVFRRGRWVMDKKEARSILGVNKDASKNDIEKKYVVLLKKYRIEINRLKEAASEAEREEAIRAEQEEAADTAEAVAEDADAGTTDVGQSAIDPEASGIADGGQSAIDPETSGLRMVLFQMMQLYQGIWTRAGRVRSRKARNRRSNFWRPSSAASQKLTMY